MLDHSAIADQPILIEVTAPWCHVCRAMQPDLDRVTAEYRGRVSRRMVDASVDGEMVASLGVRGTPTLIGLSQGEEVFRRTGRIGVAELDRLIADLAAGRPTTLGKGSDPAIRLAAGTALIALGLIATAWLPLGSGVATVVWGLVGWRQRR